VDLLPGNNPLIKMQVLVYGFMVFCVFADVLTTMYGLTLPGIVEANLNVVPKMLDGTWWFWELIYITANVAVSVFFINVTNFKHKTWFLSGPYLYGYIRLIAGASNMGLILANG